MSKQYIYIYIIYVPNCDNNVIKLLPDSPPGTNLDLPITTNT